MSGPLIVAEGLHKAFPIHDQGRGNFSDMFRLLLGKDVPKASVLSDISLSVAPGESLGIIGENGAGKSTLLKLLTGVLCPTRGSVDIRCRVGALIELGAGFDRELSGRQNIGLAAGLMGWSQGEIAEREEDILAFAELGQHIDEPVKNYSSGMVVRLGFSIIAAVRPELLITDEALAVGDESFQKKCIRWMEDFLSRGGTLLLVSHSMYHVQKLCKHAMWIKDGRVESYGDVFDVTQAYLSYHERKSVDGARHDIETGYSGGEYRVTGLRLNGAESEASCTVEMGQSLLVEVEVYSPDGLPPKLSVGIIRADGTPVYGTTSEIDDVRPERLAEQHFGFAVEMSALPLLPGDYSVRLHSLDSEGMRVFDTVESTFTVIGRTREIGFVRLPHRWS